MDGGGGGGGGGGGTKKWGSIFIVIDHIPTVVPDKSAKK